LPGILNALDVFPFIIPHEFTSTFLALLKIVQPIRKEWQVGNEWAKELNLHAVWIGDVIQLEVIRPDA